MNQQSIFSSELHVFGLHDMACQICDLDGDVWAPGKIMAFRMEDQIVLLCISLVKLTLFSLMLCLGLTLNLEQVDFSALATTGTIEPLCFGMNIQRFGSKSSTSPYVAPCQGGMKGEPFMYFIKLKSAVVVFIITVLMVFWLSMPNEVGLALIAIHNIRERSRWKSSNIWNVA